MDHVTQIAITVSLIDIFIAVLLALFIYDIVFFIFDKFVKKLHKITLETCTKNQD